jgi:hypothetical protein
MVKTTILVEEQTREILKKIGTKGQTYDQIIIKLMQRKDLPESNLTLVSSKSIGAQ